jgi:8-oxo-dGTP diphosphatase
MWLHFFTAIWRRVPKRARRLGYVLANARFTVTVAAVITDEQERVLLLKHRFRPGHDWGIPGGFINAKEQPEEALRRELREEIGVEVDNLEIALIHSLEYVRQVEIVYRATLCNQPVPCSTEILEAQWFAVSAFPPGLISYQRMLISRALKQPLKI